MLLINGMPVIHIELKKSGIPVSQAYNQIEKYSHEGIFSGLFSLVQIFVAMEPNESVYFANPGPDGKFNPDYYFHWADFNNEPINEWDKVASTLLSIPMAHQLIGFYTVADDSDGVLKVMRSYQYFAASAISDKVAKAKWEGNNQLGGYVEVNVTHRPDGTARPCFIKFENGEKYEIDRVIQKCRAASTKVGGTGIRYTVQICGKPTFLFDEENGKWFVEAKT